MLLRKGDKPPGIPSSYRPIYLLDVAGKLLEKITAGRLAVHLKAEGDILEYQYRFQAGRSTNDVVNAFCQIVVTACNRQRFCIAVSLDIPWQGILNALDTVRVPSTYLLRMVRFYLRDRKLHNETSEGTREATYPRGRKNGK